MARKSGKKKIIIPIVAVILVAAIGAGCWFTFGQKTAEPVNVYPFMYIGMTEYWGDQQESYGPVTTDNIQTVFLTATQTVTDIPVQPGDTVKKGDLLMAFDTTLTDISLERERLKVEKLKLDVEDAYEYLAEINAMRPMVIPSFEEPEETEPDPGVPLAGAYQISSNPLFEGTTEGTALICWLGSDTAIDEALMAKVLSAAIDYRIQNAQSSTPETPAEPTEPSDPTDPMEVTDPTESTDASDPTESTDPTEPSTPTEPSDPTEPSAPTEPIVPEVDRSRVYVVFKVTEGNLSKGSVLTWQGMCITYDAASDSYRFRFYDASSFQDHTLPEPEVPDTQGPQIDFGSGFTASQIAQMRSEQEKAIRDLQFQLKMAEVDYKIMQTEVADGNVYAQIDGTVVSVLTPEEAIMNMQPIIKVSSGGGFYVEGSVSELQKDNLQLGQEVTVNDWDTGMTYTGTVHAIADYPLPDDGGFYGNGNPNVSLYPFTVFIDESADLQAGSYVSVMYSAASVESGIYLENPFVRTEQGKSYVFVQGEDGLLEKRYVTTGKSLWGSYTEILEGLTPEDLIAFPYGKHVVEGAQAVESDISTLYEY